MSLTYLTGGMAWGRITTQDILTANGTVAKLVDSYQFNSDTTRTGWTIGAGAEQRFSGNWTAKIEYLFMDFGRVGSPEFLYAGNVTTNSVGLLIDLRSKFINNVLRTGISYSF